MSIVPPNDVAAERAVISAALLDRSALDVVLERLSPEKYYDVRNRIVHRAMSDLTSNGVPVDLVSVMNWIRERELVQRSGGATYVGDVIDETPAIANVDAHCAIVRDKAVMRSAIAVCQRYGAEGYSHAGDPKSFLGSLEQAIFDLGADRQRGEPRALREALTEGFTDIMTTLDAGGRVMGVSTGLRDLDKSLSGLHPGELVILGARPGMGKSALAMSMAVAAAKPREQAQVGAGIFSLEMPDKQLAIRALCSDAGVSLHATRTAEFRYGDIDRLTEAAESVGRLPIQLDDTPAITLSELRGKARRMATNLERLHGVPLGIIVLDYLQLMTGKGQNRENEIGAISRGLKQVAKELKVPVVALAQLNRAVESRPNKRPMLSDLRDSGSIEQDADVVLFIYRDDYYNPESKDAGIAELLVAKQRNGPTGMVRAKWDADTTTFRDLAVDYDWADPE